MKIKRKNILNSYTRFDVTSEKNKNDWDLSDWMLHYVVENFEKYVKHNAIQELILDSNSIPSNIEGPKNWMNILER